MQVIVYLDRKHLEWFNRFILNNVIHDIRRLFMHKLLAEMKSGEGELNTYKNNSELISLQLPSLMPLKTINSRTISDRRATSKVS